jgi:hypothetical protein
MRNTFLLGTLKEENRSEDISVDGRIILEWILDKERECGLNSYGS